MQVCDISGSHRWLNSHMADNKLVGGGNIHSVCPQGHPSTAEGRKRLLSEWVRIEIAFSP